MITGAQNVKMLEILREALPCLNDHATDLVGNYFQSHADEVMDLIRRFEKAIAYIENAIRPPQAEPSTSEDEKIVRTAINNSFPIDHGEDYDEESEAEAHDAFSRILAQRATVRDNALDECVALCKKILREHSDKVVFMEAIRALKQPAAGMN